VLGTVDGADEGLLGSDVGWCVGRLDGLREGIRVGCSDGWLLGVPVGCDDGAPVGACTHCVQPKDVAKVPAGHGVHATEPLLLE
jgi:hypothetical protein